MPHARWWQGCDFRWGSFASNQVLPHRSGFFQVQCGSWHQCKGCWRCQTDVSNKAAFETSEGLICIRTQSFGRCSFGGKPTPRDCHFRVPSFLRYGSVQILRSYVLHWIPSVEIWTDSFDWSWNLSPQDSAVEWEEDYAASIDGAWESFQTRQILGWALVCNDGETVFFIQETICFACLLWANKQVAVKAYDDGRRRPVVEGHRAAEVPIRQWAHYT